MRKLRFACVAMMLVFAALAALPSSRYIGHGLVRGETFYGALPRSFWSQELKKYKPDMQGYLDPEEPTPSGLVRHFQGKFAPDSLVFHTKFQRGGQTAVPVLVELLRDPDSRVRENAAWLLCWLGEDALSAVSPLAGALDDRDEIAFAAMKALRAIDPDGKAALAAYLNVKGEPARVRLLLFDATDQAEDGVELARETLHGIGLRAVPVLVKSLAESAFDAARWEAAALLGRIAPDDGVVVTALVQALQDPDPAVRAIAATSLGGNGSQAAIAVPALLNVLERPSERYEAGFKALPALAQIGPGARDAVPALTKMLDDDNLYLAKLAADTLGAIGPDARPAVPALQKALSSRYEELRERAAEALKRIESDAADGKVP